MTEIDKNKNPLLSPTGGDVALATEGAKSGEQLTAVVEFRPASDTDFYHEESIYNEDKKCRELRKVRNVGMQFFLLNSTDQLQCYHLKPTSNAVTLMEFIKAGRCFVMKEVEV